MQQTKIQFIAQRLIDLNMTRDQIVADWQHNAQESAEYYGVSVKTYVKAAKQAAEQTK